MPHLLVAHLRCSSLLPVRSWDPDNCCRTVIVFMYRAPSVECAARHGEGPVHGEFLITQQSACGAIRNSRIARRSAPSEQIALVVSDYDATNGVLSVTRARVAGIDWDRTKIAEDRRVELCARARSVLARQLRLREELALERRKAIGSPDNSIRLYQPACCRSIRTRNRRRRPHDKSPTSHSVASNRPIPVCARDS
jgi:hypothetical protein